MRVRLANLTRLDLPREKISDAGLEHLTGLTNLKTLRIDDVGVKSTISDAGLRRRFSVILL